MLDVTDEVAALKQEMLAQGQAIGGRKLSFVMEKRYKEQTGLEASLNAMWAGEKYYMMLYREYTDLRLVAAPPVSIAAFGGDEDNWEWPQQKCDFTLYRLYENDAPYRPEKWLKIAPEGVREGDYTMVIGYPGRTRRYASSYEVENTATLSHPITTRIRKGQMAIINRWMEADPALRLKYSDTYFSLSNVQELNEGEMLCWRRFGVVEHAEGNGFPHPPERHGRGQPDLLPRNLVPRDDPHPQHHADGKCQGQTGGIPPCPGGNRPPCGT